ncbi:ISP domain-containing protein [Bimuria novae-zelandiae CBS 107.79]|uniref:Choline monooxygenase, chloroplastic n=1 Tax=Bimuria novae-zelandiae CBS 107.79 TaxID=1447943 RepID=A0A6A5V7U7_9PLEO|nr:ISP domain-containing protein [Bimuria novae-zelandiae CBS 107.79]
MAAILNYVGLGGASKPNPPLEKEKETMRALPANWYTSPEMYELERRAIFSRKWLILTHSLRIKNAGDFLRYQIAGFDIVVSRDRSGNVTAFHNVCRHRAYPVIEQDQGTAKIFACRYHGWSYGLNGKLAKAPGYQDIPDFDKSQNGLFSIHTRVDVNGFIWVNLDAQTEPEVPWEKDFEGVDQQERFKHFDFSNFDFDHVWKIDAEYNWKIAADNYNECYHCATTHPDVQEMATLEAYDVTPKDAHIDHDASQTEEQIKKGLHIASTFYWPNASMTVSPSFFFMQKFLPTSATTTHIVYEVFRNRHSSDAEFEKISAMFKRIMSEDKVLCNQAQKNLNAGVFVNGELHPHMEKGPLYFQKMCREEVVGWHKREQKEKREIWPARQKLPTKEADEDVEFCNSLSCSDGNEKLAW